MRRILYVLGKREKENEGRKDDTEQVDSMDVCASHLGMRAKKGLQIRELNPGLRRSPI